MYPAVQYDRRQQQQQQQQQDRRSQSSGVIPGPHGGPQYPPRAAAAAAAHPNSLNTSFESDHSATVDAFPYPLRPVRTAYPPPHQAAAQQGPYSQPHPAHNPRLPSSGSGSGGPVGVPIGAPYLQEVANARLGLSPRHVARSNTAGAGGGGPYPASSGTAPHSAFSPLHLAAAALGPSQRVVWNPRAAPNPFAHRFSVPAFILYCLFLGACAYYFYVRIAFTLNMGSHTWYGIFVLVVEFMGLSAVLPYGFLLWRYTGSKGSRGLPIDDGRAILPADKRFNVHIMVPCYKESLDVIMSTVSAALGAEVPPGVTRTLYLCDDGKDSRKKEFIDSLGKEACYVSGRSRSPGEINGKSANLNHCLRHIIFPAYEGRPGDIPLQEVLVVFDADMAAKRNFLLKVLEGMWDDSVSLVLTPQAFSNIEPRADIFNNINQQFWEYVLPGCDAWGYIACTGTNFCLRARSLATVGFFPEYTITEDYALSMELKSAGFKGRYLAEYLAVGEAPDEIRNVCRQRSRWTKGHMQIFFSKRCPLLNWRLPLLHKLLYTNGTWAYFTTIATTITFVMVPFNSLVFGYHPVTFSREFAIAATIYLPLNVLLMNYVRRPGHLKGQWMASISNHILCFTYMKAVVNTVLSKLGFKAKAGFKATDKSGGSKPIAAVKNLVTGIARTASGSLPMATKPHPLAAAAAAAGGVPHPSQRSGSSSSSSYSQGTMGGGTGTRITSGASGGSAGGRGPVGRSGAQHQQQQQKKKKVPRGCWLWINAKTLEGALDPLFLALSASISLAALGAGVYTIIKSKAFEIQVNSWEEFSQLFTAGRLDVYLLVPMLWALVNLIPPTLFFIYFFTKGRLLQALCTLMQLLGLLLSLAAVASLWVVVLVPYQSEVKDAPINDLTNQLTRIFSGPLYTSPAPSRG